MKRIFLVVIGLTLTFSGFSQPGKVNGPAITWEKTDKAKALKRAAR